jgi:hypothetical protein
VPDLTSAMRRLTDDELRLLVGGAHILANGRLDMGQHRLADVFWALMVQAAEEGDRRKIAFHEMEADLGPGWDEPDPGDVDGPPS